MTTVDSYIDALPEDHQRRAHNLLDIMTRTAERDRSNPDLDEWAKRRLADGTYHRWVASYIAVGPLEEAIAADLGWILDGVDPSDAKAIFGPRWDSDPTRHNHYWAFRAKQARTQERRRKTLARKAQLRERDPMAVRQRDSQRSKVYKAEEVIKHDGRSFTTVADMQAYVDKLLGSAWFKRRFPTRSIEVHPGKGRRSAAGGSRGATRGAIYMPLWARKGEYVILHEIAHVITQNTHGDNVAWHGREFCHTLLQLVRHKMGDEAWRKLKASFKESKVKYSLPRNLTPEQRQAAADRLLAAKKRES